MISPSGKIGTVGGLRNYSTDGLILNVDFSNDYGFSGVTGYDLSVNKDLYSTPSSFNSVVSGSTATPGYIDLDGTLNYLLAGKTLTDLTTASQITVDAWFNVDPIASGSFNRTIVANGSTNTGTPGFAFVAAVITGNTLSYHSRGSAASATAVALLINATGVTANRGQWVNGFFSFDYTPTGLTFNTKFYKTAGLSASQNVFTSAISFTGSSPINIGRRPGGLQYFDGKISSVKIYNRILSSNEMDFNYNKSKTRYGHT